MQQPTKDEEVQELARQNLRTLAEKTVFVHGGTTATQQQQVKKSTFFECGEMWMKRWYSMQTEVQEDYYGSLLPSILNFYIATHATIFVGVARSSWSADVWTTRYYQGKGAFNFQYTPDGIIPVPNGGLPPAHKNCEK
jgi:hypothetical protein